MSECERASQKITNIIPALFAGDYIGELIGHNRVLFLKVSSQTLYIFSNFEMFHFATYLTFPSDCWCNGLQKFVSFTDKNIVRVQITLSWILMVTSIESLMLIGYDVLLPW